jgi:hypothetical protein
MTKATRTTRRSVALLLIALALVAAGCGKDDTPAKARPSTTARLQLLQPVPNQVSGPDLTVKVNLIGAKVVPRTSSKLRGDEGHIHLSLDGRLVSMAYGTTQKLDGLKAGPHSLQAEFVAADHQPFSNRIVAAVLFTVKA